MTDPHWTTFVALGISTVAVLIAFVSTITSYYLFRTQIDPLVVVYLTPDDRVHDVIKIVIENIGKGMAKNVTFRPSEPLPDRALEGFDHPDGGPMKDGPLIDGIPALGPGAKRVWTWGTYEGLKKALGDRTVYIRVKCDSDRVGIFLPKEHEVVCPIEIRSFVGTDAAGTNWEQKSSHQLKRIADALTRAGRATGGP